MNSREVEVVFSGPQTEPHLSRAQFTRFINRSRNSLVNGTFLISFLIIYISKTFVHFVIVKKVKQKNLRCKNVYSNVM